MRPLGLLASVVIALAALPSCDEGCLRGGDACRLPTPCRPLTFRCGDEALEIRALRAGDAAPGGLDALAAGGDVLLGNSRIVAAIAGIGNQNFLDPNGGSLLDLGNRGRDDDGLNQVLQVVGILPDDSVHYTSMLLLDERPARVAVQVHGTLFHVPAARVSTLYEVRPCEPGVRIRTEIWNGTPDPQLWALSDGFYWSKREPIPFTPAIGEGFDHPPFNLLTIDGAFRAAPFLAASSHGGAPVGYAAVGCNLAQLEGFHSEVVSSFGMPKTVVAPRDHLVLERFLAVSPSGDVAGAAAIALDARGQLFGEKSVTLRGTVGRPISGAREASILISEATASTPAARRIPWAQVVPSPDGTFRAQLPAGRDYLVEVHSFGRKVLEREVTGLAADRDLGALDVPAVARVALSVRDAGGERIDAEVFVVPADDATRAAVEGSFHGQFGRCAPWLGLPPGASPACNRALVRRLPDAPTLVEIPPGRYHLYAFHGPFWTLARHTVELPPRDQLVDFALTALPLPPSGSVSADLHVHGAASFDSSIPDVDRVLSFAAVGLDVIVATDHDVVYDYRAVVDQLGLGDRMSTVVGVETTGHIPFLRVPGRSFPLVIGHYNLWPLRYQPGMPRNGGPFDELVEPGALFDRADPLFSGLPLIQLNHPWADTEFGRDLGFPRALGLNLLRDLPPSDDGTAAGMYVRAPNAGGHPNDDHHAQEVMNGTRNEMWLPYRAFWFYSLDQGRLRTGTANSDSHGLTDSTVGSPRNVVFAATRPGPGFEVDKLNQAIRDGAVLGTNGPVILATIRNTDGEEAGFGLRPIRPAADATLKLEVSAAPWVPVEEIRIVVNGQVAKTIGPPAIARPADPFGTAGLVRWMGEIPLSELLPASGDAWLVVEAGHPLPLFADLGGGAGGVPDGVPDTTDNNGDGRVDSADVAMGQLVGPLRDPDPPKDEADARYHFAQVVTDGAPCAFTNPFVLDRDGNGRFDPPGRRR